MTRRPASTAPKGPKRQKIEVNWYLREWMAYLKLKQADMVQRTGWTKTKASHLYNDQQDYSTQIVKEAAHALNIAVFELFMLPADAMALRRYRESAVRLAAENTATFRVPQLKDGTTG